MTDHATQVIDNISRLIAQEMSALSHEYWTPKYSADQSDAELKFRKARVVRLQDIRTELEFLMYGLERD